MILAPGEKIPIFKQDLSGGGNNSFRSRGQWKKATKLHVSQMSTEELEHYFIVITSVPKQKKTGFFPEELNDDGHLNGKFFY